jgi:hypothetical protein
MAVQFTCDLCDVVEIGRRRPDFLLELVDQRAVVAASPPAPLELCLSCYGLLNSRWAALVTRLRDLVQS